MKKFPKPIAAIEPFTGKAAKWLWKYLRETRADPIEQAKVNERIREGAARAVRGTPEMLRKMRRTE